MTSSDHAVKTDRIIAAMCGLIVRPKGRHIRRYTHGWMGPDRKQYFVGYVWQRLHSNHYTGMTCDAYLGKGADFEAALANAVKLETAKRNRLEAKLNQPQP